MNLSALSMFGQLGIVAAIVGIVFVLAGVFCMWVRDEFKADPFFDHCDWEKNAWLKDKDTLLGVHKWNS